MPRAVVLILLIVLGGCQPSGQVEVARGADAGGAWSAWVYHGTGDQGVCLEIRADGRDVDKICGLAADNTGSWQPDAPLREPAFIAITTEDGRAALARVTMADGRQVRAPVVRAPQLVAIGFVVLSLAPPGAKARQVEILDGSGVVLTTLPLN